MSVIMPTGRYKVLRRSPRPEVEDEHGVPVPSVSGLAVVGAEAPGAVRSADNGTYTFRLEPEMWPIYVDDLISGSDGTRYVIQTVKLNKNVAASALDYIGGTCIYDPNPRR